jgi:hypothetical protein
METEPKKVEGAIAFQRLRPLNRAVQFGLLILQTRLAVELGVPLINSGTQQPCGVPRLPN